MLTASLITLREGLEAALIVGIVLGYLKKIGIVGHQRTVWIGVALAIAVSVVAALALQAVGAGLEGQAEQVFEGTTMLLAAGVLTWMIFWMQAQAGRIKGHLEAEIQQAISAGTGWGLFSLAFIAVLREGLETVLFLTAALLSSTAVETVVGGLLGLVVAIALGWLIFLGAVRLPLGSFFRVTGALLIVFAAGLMAHAAYEFAEAGIIPAVIEHLWNTKAILDDGSALGSLLRSLVGYNDDPSLIEVLAYLGYYLGVGWGLWHRKRLPAQRASI